MNRRVIVLFCLLMFSSPAGNIFAQGFSNEEKEILKLQDERTPADKLYKYLSSSDEKVRVRALIALANIADTNSVDEISKLLSAPQSQSLGIKIAAGFALGQIPCTKSTALLLKALSEEKDENAIKNILNNLGKIGDENALNTVCSYKPSSDEVSGAIALSIARFGIRKIRNQSSIGRLRQLSAEIKSPEQLKYVAYAFNRGMDKQLLQSAKNEIETLCGVDNKEAVMWAYSALGKIQDDSYISFIMNNFTKQTDWRIKCNMLTAVSNLKINAGNFNDGFLDNMLDATTNENPNLSITALQAIAKLFASEDKNSARVMKIREYLEGIILPSKAVDWQIKAEAIKALAKLFKDDYRSSLFSIFSASDNYDIKAEAVRSFQYMDNALVYKELRDSISADVQRYNALHPNKDGSMIGSEDLAKVYRAFVEALAALAPKLDDENKNILRLIFTEFTSSRNSAIVDVCLTSLQDSLFIKYRNETIQIMLIDYPDFKLPKDLDVSLQYIQAFGNMKAIPAVELLKRNLKSESYDIAKASADALKNITGKDFESKITAKKYRTDFDWDFLSDFENFKTATIKTNIGEIKISLLYNEAPFTCMSFVKLQRKHYFDNLVFHRVVPNFVIQGGDPDGTGYGGPGYSIRSEFIPRMFETGMVGMASSGKDTEGSQFFITHSPQYHLDGKYTIFAFVISGMDVVDRVKIGDKIESITFSAE